MTQRIHLAGLVVEPGSTTHTQAELEARMRASISHLEDAALLRRTVSVVYGRSEIDTRHVEVPLDELSERDDWYLAVNQAAKWLSERTLRRLFQSVPEGEKVDALVTVSSSHSGFPSLSREIQEGLGIPLDAVCYDITGLGCAGPTQGLYLGHLLLQQPHIENVAVVAVDVMATHGQARRFDQAPYMEQIVAHCLASDGAAGALLSKTERDTDLLTFEGCELYTRMWPDALDLNYFSATSDNQPFLAVGKDIRTRLLEETKEFFGERIPEEPLFMHPGGAALMNRLAQAQPGLRPSINVSNAILRENGNLGAPSVMWVLERALREGCDIEPALTLFALGPGIVTTALRLTETRTIRAARAA